jgi:hypothetical protein
VGSGLAEVAWRRLYWLPLESVVWPWLLEAHTGLSTTRKPQLRRITTKVIMDKCIRFVEKIYFTVIINYFSEII